MSPRSYLNWKKVKNSTQLGWYFFWETNTKVLFYFKVDFTFFFIIVYTWRILLYYILTGVQSSSTIIEKKVRLVSLLRRYNAREYCGNFTIFSPKIIFCCSKEKVHELLFVSVKVIRSKHKYSKYIENFLSK